MNIDVNNIFVGQTDQKLHQPALDIGKLDWAGVMQLNFILECQSAYDARILTKEIFRLSPLGLKCHKQKFLL